MESIKDLEDKLLQKLRDNNYDYNILNKLGYIYLHSDNRSKSEEFYLKSIEVEKDQFEPYVSLSLISTIDARLEKALYYLLKAKEKNSESPELNESIEEIKTAIISKEGKLSSSEVNELVASAEELIENDNLEEALDIYLKLYNLFPEDENIMLKTAVTLLRNEDIIIAESILVNLIELYPLNAMGHHYLGIINNLLDKVESAQKNIIRSLELKPFLADAVTASHAVYRKDYNEETVEKCPISGTDNFKLVNVINQSVNSLNFNMINPIRMWVESQDSGLVLANPRPDKDSLNNYSFELYRYSKKLIDSDIDKFITESNAYNDRLNIIENYIKKGSCLDINSDNGIFISNTRTKDWQVSGLEENYLKYKKIKESFNLEMNNTSFDNYETEEKFDLITLWESIEKMPNFVDNIKKIYSLLNDNGIFAFSFHDLESALVLTLGKNYPAWYYPDYLYLFKSSVLKKLLKDIGFKVINIQTVARKYMSNVEFYCQK